MSKTFAGLRNFSVAFFCYFTAHSPFESEGPSRQSKNVIQTIIVLSKTNVSKLSMSRILYSVNGKHRLDS